MESGIGWANLNIAFSSVDPNTYYVAAMQAVVDTGKLTIFAMSAAEKLFLQRNNVSTLFSPKYRPESGSYNSGNRLTCLWMREYWLLSFVFHFHFRLVSSDA